MSVCDCECALVHLCLRVATAERLVFVTIRYFYTNKIISVSVRVVYVFAVGSQECTCGNECRHAGASDLFPT